MSPQNAKGSMAKMDANAIFANITETNFQEEVLECTQPVVVQFSAKWSGPCHIMDAMIEKLVKELKCQIKFCKIDIDDCELIARQYGIRELPTLLFFKDGRPIDHIIGAIPKKILAARFNALLQTES